MLIYRFLSTPSARRATGRRQNIGTHTANFYPRPPRGGRRCRRLLPHLCRTFLSTPSARRATCVGRRHAGGAFISIHALREEGDAIAYN